MTTETLRQEESKGISALTSLCPRLLLCLPTEEPQSPENKGTSVMEGIKPQGTRAGPGHEGEHMENDVNIYNMVKATENHLVCQGFCLFVLSFLGLHQQHMEVPMLGV